MLELNERELLENVYLVAARAGILKADVVGKSNISRNKTGFDCSLSVDGCCLI